MYDARQIANWFVLRASQEGRRLSIMQLLKLVYIAHGWHLEVTGNPLFRNRIEAWQHGPVIPDVYKEFRPKGVIVDHIDQSVPVAVPDRVAKFLDEIYAIYGQHSPFHLSEITHVPNGPWDVATKRDGWFAHIPDELILSHYRDLRARRSSKVKVH